MPCVVQCTADAALIDDGEYRLENVDVRGIDRAAMMNAIYLNHPEYAVQHNRREQEGLNDAGAQFWRWLGLAVEPEGRADNLITLYSGVGVDYLRF